MASEISNNENAKHKVRLRERYLKDGLSGFHDYEVLEIILSYSIIRKDTKPIAKELLKKFHNLNNVFHAPPQLLMEIDGIGERTASLIKLFKDVNIFRLQEHIIGKDYFNSSDDIFNYVHTYYKGLKNEEFKIIYLSAKNTILFEETLFKGTVNEAKIYLRVIIEHIILCNAATIVIIHNHPGGTTQPSKEDILITEKIKMAINMINVHLLDHLIISDNEYYSFVGAGLL